MQPHRLQLECDRPAMTREAAANRLPIRQYTKATVPMIWRGGMYCRLVWAVP
jgi:hypothetical protein